MNSNDRTASTIDTSRHRRDIRVMVNEIDIDKFHFELSRQGRVLTAKRLSVPFF